LQVDEACPDAKANGSTPKRFAVCGAIVRLPTTHLPGRQTGDLVSTLKLEGRELEIARDFGGGLKSRLGLLSEVGLDYLTLDRSAPTLSGGEGATHPAGGAIGLQLAGACATSWTSRPSACIAHNQISLNTLEKLERKGNTLLVVEHDEDTIRPAHMFVDLGPGAGRSAAEVIAQGNVEQLMRSPASLTGNSCGTPCCIRCNPGSDGTTARRRS